MRVISAECAAAIALDCEITLGIPLVCILIEYFCHEDLIAVLVSGNGIEDWLGISEAKNGHGMENVKSSEQSYRMVLLEFVLTPQTHEKHYVTNKFVNINRIY